MTISLVILSMIVLIVLPGILLFGPRPTMKSGAPPTTVPTGLTLTQLQHWLNQSEAKVNNLIPGAEAIITWVEPEHPSVTALSFLYIHGFSATRQETSPVTAHLADAFNANAVHARLAGHGIEGFGITSSAEDWLQSVVDAWHIAAQLGEKVVIISTSTGSALSVWLAQQPSVKERIHAMLFMSPNFGIRHPLEFVLTWPWSPLWLPLLFGREHTWNPSNELEAKYWTHRYSTLAVIEMQKTIDWLQDVDFSTCQLPLATMYMKNDSTIDPVAAVRLHEAWGASIKQLIPVTLDGDTPQHVFVGDITAPHRTRWCVDRFAAFLKRV